MEAKKYLKQSSAQALRPPIRHGIQVVQRIGIRQRTPVSKRLGVQLGVGLCGADQALGAAVALQLQ